MHLGNIKPLLCVKPCAKCGTCGDEGNLASDAKKDSVLIEETFVSRDPDSSIKPQNDMGVSGSLGNMLWGGEGGANKKGGESFTGEKEGEDLPGRRNCLGKGREV